MNSTINKKRFQVKRRNYYRSSDIAGCSDCDWNGVGGREARKHALDNGHNTWNEYNIVNYYDVLK